MVTRAYVYAMYSIMPPKPSQHKYNIMEGIILKIETFIYRQVQLHKNNVHIQSVHTQTHM